MLVIPSEARDLAYSVILSEAKDLFLEKRVIPRRFAPRNDRDGASLLGMT
jgi:hypothetical protein